VKTKRGGTKRHQGVNLGLTITPVNGGKEHTTLACLKRGSGGDGGKDLHNER